MNSATSARVTWNIASRVPTEVPNIHDRYVYKFAVELNHSWRNLVCLMKLKPKDVKL